MKKTLKGYLLGFLTATFLLSGVVYAASNTKTIEVIYDNIKVYKDNVLCELKDANGTTVEPFIYNGTTYMPIRGTAKLAGMDVTWDGATKSVNLWDKIHPEDTLLMDVCPPYNGEGLYIDDFEMAGEEYSGFYLGYRTSGNCYALINVNGKYSSAKMIIAPIDDANSFCEQTVTINFYLDGEMSKSIKINEGDYPKEISIPLNSALQLKVEMEFEEGYDLGPIGFGNIVLK